MKNRLIPFYRDMSKGSKGYTLFLDKQSQRVYKVYHKNEGGIKYWIAFFLVVALMEAIKNIHLPLSNPIYFGITFLLVVISGLIGIYIYKFYYKDLREVYFTPSMVEEYIKRGKKQLKAEVITAIAMFIFLVLFAYLYLMNYWIIWLIFALFLVSMMALVLCGLPMERFKLCKKGTPQ